MVSETICGGPFLVVSSTSYFGLFTECFQDTALTWPPFIFIIACFCFYFATSKKPANIGNTWLNISKTVMSMVMVCACVVDICVRAFETHSSSKALVHISSPCLLLFTMIFSLLFIQREKWIGKQVSGVLFLLWCLMSVTTAFKLIPRVHTLASHQDVSYVRYKVVHCSLLLLLSLLQLLLAGLFVDGKARSENPELNACFVSRLTYWWMNGLLMTGYKKGLKVADLWPVQPEMSAQQAYDAFGAHWRPLLKKHYQRVEKAGKKECLHDGVGVVASEALVLNNSQHQQQPYSHIKVDVNFRPATSRTATTTKSGKKRVPRPSLWQAMFMFTGKQMLFCALLKLCHDLCMFLKPKLLELILRFIATPDAPSWHGYVYSILIFIVSIFESLIINQYFQRTFNVGVNARTALTSTIYRKTMCLNNEARKNFTQGEIVNLMSTDAQKFLDLSGYIHMFWSAPLQIIISIVLLYSILGPSIFAGIGVMVCLIPLNAFIAKKMRSFNALQMKFKDSRIKLMAEILNGIKVLKLYAWEDSFEDKILQKRQLELDVFKRMSFYAAGSSFLWTCSPILVSVATFATYILSSDKNVLDPEKAFVSLSLFNILRFPMIMLTQLIASLIQAFVSVKRLEVFLMSEELEESAIEHKIADNLAVCFDDGSFDWELSADKKPVLEDITLSIKKGSLVGVVGQVGSGKSTLLSAILGDTEKIKGSCAVNGSMAYVAQQAWIQNATMENNILFGQARHEDRYNKVVEACALLPDFELLPAKDGTEVGEQGITLSGGQKQRLSLARAVYANKDVYLLDDTLSAVDAHVGKHIFQRVIGNQGLLRNKTRIFVTHGLKFLREFDNIVVLSDGRISEVGTYDELLANNSSFAEFLRQYIEEETKEENLEMNEEDIILREEILQHVLDDKHSIQQKIGRLRRDTLRSDNSGTTSARPLSSVPDTPAIHEEDVDIRKSMQKLATLEGALDYPADDNEDVFDDNEAGVAMTEMLRKSASNLHLSPSALKCVGLESVSENKEGIPLIKQDVKAIKLIDDEKMETGGIKLSVYKAYLRSIGIPIVIVVVLLQIAQAMCSVGANFWLSDWSNQNVVGKSSNLSNFNPSVFNSITTILPPPLISSSQSHSSPTRLLVYALLGLGQSTAVLVGAFIFVRGAIKATAILHKQVLHRVFRCPMHFFESTPVGRLLNVFSKDVDSVDQQLPMSLDVWVKCFMAVLGMIFVISFNIPIFLLVILPLGLVYYIVQRFYIRTSRQLKRIESVSRSPVFSHFSETIQGVPTIRAFKQIPRFISESEKRIDLNTMSYNPTVSANRWLALRLEFIGNCLVLAASVFSIVWRHSISPGIVGLCITYALSITQTLNWLVRMTSDVETNIVSVERMREYLGREIEAEWEIQAHKPPYDWPNKGAIDFKSYSLAYKNSEPALKRITCSFKPGERVGMVGRTGAGKSSMTLALFRILEPLEGSIVIDGVDVASIGLHDLRSKLTIIPQDPVLFSGPLRMNLDPFDTYTDEQVWTSLRYVQLDAYVRQLPECLEYAVGEGGVNFSLGQRQLLCLARALLRKSQVLVLDEATAAVDAETDQLIQSTIREQFQGCTTLTIAHRINTIMDYSRILVMEQGRVLEFDTPQSLMANPSSAFRSLALEAGISSA